VEVSTHDTRDGTIGGLFDPRMGVLENGKLCRSCGLNNHNCPGHFGHIKLNYPIANPLFKDEIAAYANCFCMRKMCARLVLTKDQMQLLGFLKKEGQARIFAVKEYCENIEECPYCKEPHGTIKYYSKDNKFLITYSKKDEFISVSYEQFYDMFNNIKDEDLILMGFNRDKLYNGRPSNLIIKNLLVLPPICRSPVSSGTVECHDDLTYKYLDIIKVNNKIVSNKDLNERKIAEYIEQLDFHITMLMDNTKSKITDNKNRMIKCIHSRMKGKCCR
jgi:DNA-directed RNA polymerase subunit A'